LVGLFDHREHIGGERGAGQPNGLVIGCGSELPCATTAAMASGTGL
jgi:hypothetical protein